MEYPPNWKSLLNRLLTGITPSLDWSPNWNSLPIVGIFLSFPGGSVGKESSAIKEAVCSAGDMGLIPGSGRLLEEGNGDPFQYSCLGNPIDREAWQATVDGVTTT